MLRNSSRSFQVSLHQQQQRHQQEWFTSRRAFLSEFDSLIDSAKEYQIPPQTIDDRVREERSRWYAERVRGSLLRLMVEDPSGREEVFEKLEDLSIPNAGGDPIGLAMEIAQFLSKGPLGSSAAEQGVAKDLPERLATANTDAGKAEALKEEFFKADDGTVPEDHQKYLDMLLYQGSSMEQVVDRILEERQAATGARDQTNKLNQRLDELRRARAAHEAQKTRKAQRRESLAQQKVPDELYELPACAVCGNTTNPGDFFCCSICTILASSGVQEKQTVFCSETCDKEGHPAHIATHTCSSGLFCTQQQHPQPRPGTTAHGSDKYITDGGTSAPSQNDIRFCTECLTTLKQASIWCSLACADANFQTHREQVHIPARNRLGLAVNDEQQLEYLPLPDNNTGDGSGSRKYRAKDVGGFTTSLGEAVQEWEEQNRVRLQSAAV
ncbi:hypothetical protein N657DRAFT_670887 [Parathielavia appendiculata]|uniref:Uncharacterized protein n=1 Tax=Parathielavia appendiculata TaxID=2587402 RepID=A0AAN6U320_9PEZI|nr:hypothetical protein N657DRAFT_670887 [Parathielavia appendiculata]